MKKILQLTLCLMIICLVVGSGNAQTTGGDDNYYITKVYVSQGGDSIVIKHDGRITLRTGGRIFGGTKWEATADSIIMKTGSYLIFDDGTVIRCDSLRSHTGNIDTVWAKRIIMTGNLVMTADILGTDSIYAHDANIDTITGKRLNLTGAINAGNSTATLDSIRAAGANIDTTTGMKITLTGNISSATANVSGNIISQDSVRGPSVDADTLWNVKGFITSIANSVMIGKAALPAGQCSVHVYVQGMKKNDLVIANFQMHPDSVWSNRRYTDSTWVNTRPWTDSLFLFLGGRRTGQAAGSDTISWFRIGIK